MRRSYYLSHLFVVLCYDSPREGTETLRNPGQSGKCVCVWGGGGSVGDQRRVHYFKWINNVLRSLLQHLGLPSRGTHVMRCSPEPGFPIADLQDWSISVVATVTWVSGSLPDLYPLAKDQPSPAVTEKKISRYYHVFSGR